MNISKLARSSESGFLSFLGRCCSMARTTQFPATIFITLRCSETKTPSIANFMMRVSQSSNHSLKAIFSPMIVSRMKYSNGPHSMIAFAFRLMKLSSEKMNNEDGPWNDPFHWMPSKLHSSVSCRQRHLFRNEESVENVPRVGGWRALSRVVVLDRYSEQGILFHSRRNQFPLFPKEPSSRCRTTEAHCPRALPGSMRRQRTPRHRLRRNIGRISDKELSKEIQATPKRSMGDYKVNIVVHAFMKRKVCRYVK